MKKPVYFDYAAATPMDSRIRKAMEPYWSEEFYNPSSMYEPARRAKQALQTARHQVAQALGAKPNEIIFTAGATEANNLAIHGVAKSNAKDEIIVSSIEHESILEPAAELSRQGSKTKIAKISPAGSIDVQEIERLINDNTVLVSVMYANNEVGTIQPIAKISQLVDQIRQDRKRRGTKQPLYFHTDAAQAANYLDLHVSRLGVDMMTLNGSKIYGPKQSGCLYVRSGIKIRPFILGGGQEQGLRSGTENVAGSVGFASALQLAAELRKSEATRLMGLRNGFIRAVLSRIKDIKLNGNTESRLPNNINLAIKNVSGEELVHRLDAVGILAATGSACSANNDRPSHVLAALGLTKGQINSSLRISLGRATTTADLDYLLKQLVIVVGKLRAV